MFEELLERVAAALRRAGIPYMVIGGQAVLLYGEPRLTKDIDITVGLGIDGLPALLSLARELGFRNLVDDAETFVRNTMVLPLEDEGTGIRIDFIFSFLPYERQAIERANEVPIGQGSVRFASLEDVIIHKIIAGRARDLEDVRSLLLKNTGIDSHYVEGWLAEFEDAVGEAYLTRFQKVVDELSL